MKHLLTGVAMAAALAIAAPAWAQSTPSPAPAKPAAAAPMAAKKPVHHWHHRMSAGDQMTEQLNAQELQRIMGGAPPPPPPPPTPGGNNPTSGSAGPFAPH